MQKYLRLRDYLKRQRNRTVVLSFQDLELVLRAMLPKAAAHPEWWAPTDGPVRAGVPWKAWADLGYEAELLPSGDRVCFRKAKAESDAGDPRFDEWRPDDH